MVRTIKEKCEKCEKCIIFDALRDNHDKGIEARDLVKILERTLSL